VNLEENEVSNLIMYLAPYMQSVVFGGIHLLDEPKSNDNIENKCVCVIGKSTDL